VAPSSPTTLECHPVPRRRIVSIVLVLATVALAGSWFGWGRQGLRPVDPSSTNAEGIDDLYAFIGAFAVLIFLSVMIPLALILGRYRERGLPREAEGPQVRGNTRLELLWTAIPTLIVVVLAGFTLYKADGIDNPEPARAQGQEQDGGDALEIRVEGRQFYWRYVYPNGAVAIDRIRLPLDRVSSLQITAPDWDVVHSYWIPALGGKRDAIPGQVNELNYLPTKTGVFDGKCGELCGLQHSAMTFEAEVLSQEEFDRWLDEAAGDDEALGQAQFEAVCSKCHFAAPEYAPDITGNPILGDAEQLRRVVTEGRGRMPAVGRGWTDRELDALYEYVRQFAPPPSEGEADGG
jgi:cytochrome c oxidase subunit II